jgi:hypothetical protein
MSRNVTRPFKSSYRPTYIIHLPRPHLINSRFTHTAGWSKSNLFVGFTIGSSPFDESCKKRRKAAATALAKPAMRNYLPMFDLETFCVIRDYREKALSTDIKDLEFNPRPFLQRFALNTTLTLCYGIRMDDAYDELLREILCILPLKQKS